MIKELKEIKIIGTKGYKVNAHQYANLPMNLRELPKEETGNLANAVKDKESATAYILYHPDTEKDYIVVANDPVAWIIKNKDKIKKAGFTFITEFNKKAKEYNKSYNTYSFWIVPSFGYFDRLANN